MKAIAFVLLLIASLPAFAGGFGPWRFGMSDSEIQAVEVGGPYKSFSNGDLETYNGDFGGEKTNVQFFLKDSRLWRIGVEAYEGTDLTEATRTWLRAYSTLSSTYGPVETPNLEGTSAAELAKAATAIVAAGGKAQMAPVTQPADEFVFSSFSSFTGNGVRYYTVTVYFDRPAPLTLHQVDTASPHGATQVPGGAQTRSTNG